MNWNNITTSFRKEMTKRRNRFSQYGRHGSNSAYLESYLRTNYHPPKPKEPYLNDIRFTQ